MCQLQGPVKVRARAWWGEAQSPHPDKPQGSRVQRLQFTMIFFFFKPPLMLYKPTVQAHSPQRASQRHSLGVWEKQQIPLAPPTPQTPTTPPLHLTSLEKGSEGAGHLLVSENLETALS